MKLAGTSLTALVLCLTTFATGHQAKKLNDADIARLLVGKWIHDEKTDGFERKSVFAANADGTWSGEVKVEIAVGGMIQVADVKTAGTWKVVDGTLEGTVKTSSNTVLARAGDTFTFAIAAIDATTLKIRNKGAAKEKVWTRAKTAS